MTYLEYLKLIHCNYTRFYMLTLLAFCVSMLFCSYSYGDMGAPGNSFSCANNVQQAFDEYRATTTFYTQANAHIEYCVPFIGRHVVRIEGKEAQLNQLRATNEQQGMGMSEVSIMTSMMVPGTFTNPGAERVLNSAKGFANGVIPSCDHLAGVSPAGVAQQTFHNYCADIRRLAGMTVAQGSNNNPLDDPESIVFNDRSLEALLRQCSNQGNMESCERGCEIISDRTHADHLHRDLFCRLNYDALTAQCRETGNRARCQQACMEGGHHESYFTCQIGQGLAVIDPDDETVIPTCRDGQVISPATNQCVDLETAQNECRERNGTWNNETNQCDDSTVACVPDPTTGEGCGTDDPGPGPGPGGDEDPLDPNNQEVVDPTQPTEEDFGQLAGLAQQLGNSFGGGGNGVTDIPNGTDSDPTSGVRAGNLGGNAADLQATRAGGHNGGTLPLNAAFQPPRGQPITGGQPPQGGQQAGGPLGGGGALGAAGLGAGGSRAGTGGRKGRRRGRRGMPHKNIRDNLAGNSYHGAQGSTPAAVTQEKDPKDRNKRRNNRVGVPGTPENNQYMAQVNDSLQRGLSRINPRKRVGVENDAFCDQNENFLCIGVIADLIERQGVLNSKGR